MSAHEKIQFIRSSEIAKKQLAEARAVFNEGERTEQLYQAYERGEGTWKAYEDAVRKK